MCSTSWARINLAILKPSLVIDPSRLELAPEFRQRGVNPPKCDRLFGESNRDASPIRHDNARLLNNDAPGNVASSWACGSATLLQGNSLVQQLPLHLDQPPLSQALVQLHPVDLRDDQLPQPLRRLDRLNPLRRAFLTDVVF